MKRRADFLLEASRVLAESLDYEQTIATVARLAVREIADWCFIDLVGDDGALVRVATEHRDGNGGPLAASSPDLALTSTICAPLIRRDRTLGALTVSTAVGRELTEDDGRMVEDLACRAAAAIENARLYAEAQRAVRAREEMLAIVTHDLRTPLSAVVAGASLLTSIDSVNPEGDQIRQRGETIQRAAQHMQRLIEDLTDLAQIDAGQFTIKRKVEDPAAVVREVRDALEPVVARRGGRLDSRVGHNLRTVLLDRARLAQVLGNLVGNASKVGASQILMGVELRENDVMFWVKDNGPGIPAEDLPMMFERYWRGRGTAYKGSGLGLPIANGLVKAHGGRLWIESTLGTGSTFFFSIPC